MKPHSKLDICLSAAKEAAVKEEDGEPVAKKKK